MKKKLYFTNAAPPEKTINSINTYVNFVYDTKTGELKLVDNFGGETKELVIGTATSTSEEGGEGEGGQGGEGGSEGGEGQGGEGGEGGDQGGTTPDDGGQGGTDGGDEPVEP